jgi:hypothetical protein
MFKPIDSELVKDAMNIGSELKAQAAPQPASERERRLEEALRESLNMLVKRGQHAKRCPQVVNGITPCSCGLDEAITAARVALEGK